MARKIDLSKTVPSERWGEFFDQFSDGNRGWYLAIESISAELGGETLIQDAPLLAMVYDRPGKGNDLVIEVGQDEVTFAHMIDAPSEVLISSGLIPRSLLRPKGTVERNRAMKCVSGAK